MKAKLGTGARFAKIEKKAEAFYEKKGKSPEKAKAIAGAVAAAIGRAKYGKAKFQKLAAKGK